MYRKLTADRIFDGFEWREDGSVLIVDNEGTIADITGTLAAGDDVEHLDGFLIPGMINAHCHLELSHLKGAIPEKTGLINFILSVVRSRNIETAQVLQHMQEGEKEMYDHGIVAVIDICNTAESAALKNKSSLYWHSLVEVINISDKNLERQWLHYNEILKGFRRYERTEHCVNLAPHAPYSVSTQTHRAINEATKNLLISIHNQETGAENDLFKNGQGSFLDFYQELGVSIPSFVSSSKSSLQTYLPHYTKGQTIILVHNSFISEEDILFAKHHAEQYGLTVFYCLCPNANLYIEDKLPPVELLIKHNCTILLGTDSYASNRQLSVAREIQILAGNFPDLSLNELLKWATSNGAKAIGNNEIGSFKKGKKPGVVLLATSDGLITGACKRIM